MRRFGIALRIVVALAAWLAATGPARAATPAALYYRVDATLSDDGATFAGTCTLTWHVPPGRARDTVPLVLYAELYRTPNPALDDVTYTWCFARSFDAGGITLGRITTAGGATCPIERDPEDGWPAGTLLWVHLPAPAAPGTPVTLQIPFTTRLPRRFGTFGRYGGALLANGGLTPHVAAVGPDGRAVAAAPPPARWDVQLRRPPTLACLLNGRHHEAGTTTVTAAFANTRWLTLAAAPRFHVYRAADGAAEVLYYRLDRDDDIGEAVVAEALLALRYGRALLGGGPARQVLVEGRLRDVFTRHGQGCTLVSDRALRVFPLLEKYHHKEIAGELFYRLAAARIGALERAPDAQWITEAAAWWMRGRYQAARGADYREVKAVVGFFSFLPIVDQVRVAPRFPFADLYFDAPYRVDLLREDVTNFATGTPDGRELAERLGDLLGRDAAEQCWRAYLGTDGALPRRWPLVAVADRAAARPIDAIVATWRRPRMPVDYRPAGFTNTRLGPHHVHARIAVTRDGPPTGLREPVPVGLTLADGAQVLTSVVAGTWGAVELKEVPDEVVRLDIDPESRLRETNRGDNSSGWAMWMLASVPRVNVDPNRGRYEIFANASLVANGDYRNRLTLGGFVEQEGRGCSLGYFRSEGWKNDPTDYPFAYGLSLFLEDLDRNFASTRSGRFNDEGVVASARATLTMDLRNAPRNPHWGCTGFLTAEWADAWFGTEFRFRLAEAGLAFTIPLWREQIVGAEFRLGVADGILPTQRLFDAGGEEAVRGLRAGDLLGEHRWLMRVEYRHTWLTELQDWIPSFPWELFTPRRLQGVFFVDTGNVADHFADLFTVGDVLTSVGYGLRLYLDFAGARYSMVRFEIAYRIDDLDEARVLFYVGASHSF